MLGSKRNHGSLEEMLLNEASALEERGCLTGAEHKLEEALNADQLQNDSLRRIKDNYYKYDIYPITREFMYSWLLEEDIDWSDMPDFRGSLYVRLRYWRELRKEDSTLLPL